MRFNCVEKPLRKLFYCYGGLVARYPMIFLTIAILITSLLAGGLPYLQYDKDTLTLLAPENGRWKTEKEIATSLFSHLDDSNMLPNRQAELKRFASVIITHAENEQSLLNKDAMGEVLRFHDTVLNLTVTDDVGKLLTFQNLCMPWNGRCIDNSILTFYDYNASMVSERQLTYPFATLPNGFQVFIGAELGGVEPYGKRGEVHDASKFAAIRLFYFLRGNKEEDDRHSALWEDKYVKVVSKFQSDTIQVVWSTSQTLLQEVDKTVSQVLSLWWVGIVLVIFCIGAASTNNWVQSQPMLCLMGMVAAAMAILASYGLMGFLEVPYNILSGSVPFLILGISLDDTFIIIGSWRQTASQKSTEQRMKECFCESALSITITSLTDAVAFSIGIFSDFRAVQAFSKTCVCAIVLCYLFQLLFFAPCLVFSGKRQEQNRHCFTFRKVKPKRKSKSPAYRIFCAGESVNDDVKGTPAMKFFKNYYAPLLNKCVVSVIVVLGYSVYLGTSMWGFTLLEEGFQERNWVLDDSHLVKYYDLQDKYFAHFGPQISVIATEEINYWDEEVQQSLEETLKELEATTYVFESPKFTTSWLRDYLQYLDKTERRGNLSKKVFIDTLQNEFLLHPLYKQYNLDIVFGENNNSIPASRFYVYSKDMNNKKRESCMMVECRRLVEKSAEPLIVYHANFVMYDQYIVMWPQTLNNLLIAGAAMFVIALFLIPHPVCALIVTASIASIIIGVLGYMSIWNIPLNHISMVNLLLCVGFSVDFSAHVCYAFISAPEDDKNDRVRHALYCLGLPILQGGLSTILACLGTSTTDAYSYRIFFKTMFLVITLGMLHGLVFLPVFLKIFLPFKLGQTMQEKKKEDQHAAASCEEKKGCMVTEKVEDSALKNGGQIVTRQITDEWKWTGPGDPTDSKEWQAFHSDISEKIPVANGIQVPKSPMQIAYKPVQKDAANEQDVTDKLLTDEPTTCLQQDVSQHNPSGNQSVTSPLLQEIQQMSLSLKYVYSGELAAKTVQSNADPWVNKQDLERQDSGQQLQCTNHQNTEQQLQCAIYQNTEQQQCADQQNDEQQCADHQNTEQKQCADHQNAEMQLQWTEQQNAEQQQKCTDQDNVEQQQKCADQDNVKQEQTCADQDNVEQQQTCADLENVEQQQKFADQHESGENYMKTHPARETRL